MKILLFGNGKMGNMIKSLMEDASDLEYAGVIDIDDIPSLATKEPVADVLVDFSHPNMIEPMVQYAIRTKTPILTGTTALGDAQFALLKEAAKTVPVLQSYNYSFGIALFKYVLETIRPMIPDGFDIELVETHHNKKIDAPSGTAKVLLKAIDPDDAYEKVYGREGMCGAREKKSIGVHAIRGGTVAGEHSVTLYGNDEIFEITHKAASRRIFAQGALNAARKLVALKPGFYTMDDIIRS